MSLGHGASISRNGLVFQYDMANTAKSWKGKPTTNYAYENGYSSSGPLIAESIPKYKELKNLAGDVKDVRYINNNTTNWLDLYSVSNISLAAGEAITISCWIYTDKPANSFNSNGNFGATLGTNASLGGATNIPTGQWFFFSKTKTNTTASTITVNTLRIETSQYTVWTDSEIDVYAANPQWEIGSFATPFVNGTRSNTEALIDISGQNNTITADSLTYNTDGTFEFDGTDDYLASPNLSLSDHTLETWTRCHVTTAGTSGNDLQSIVGNYTATAGSLGKYTCINPYGTNQFTFRIDDGASSFQEIATIASVVNQWYHLVLTYSSDGTAKAYVNGSLVGTRAFTSNIVFDSVPNNIGRSENGTTYNGDISTAQIYNRALTATEVKQNFEATRGRYGI